MIFIFENKFRIKRQLFVLFFKNAKIFAAITGVVWLYLAVCPSRGQGGTRRRDRRCGRWTRCSRHCPRAARRRFFPPDAPVAAIAGSRCLKVERVWMRKSGPYTEQVCNQNWPFRSGARYSSSWFLKSWFLQKSWFDLPWFLKSQNHVTHLNRDFAAQNRDFIKSWFWKSRFLQKSWFE